MLQVMFPFLDMLTHSSEYQDSTAPPSSGCNSEVLIYWEFTAAMRDSMGLNTVLLTKEFGERH